MKLSLSVNKIINKNILENTATIINTLKDNSGKVDMVCFGETFLQGFDCLCWIFEIDRNMAVKKNSEAIKTIQRAASYLKIAVAFGYIEIKGKKLYSSYMIISNKGKIIYNYRRITKGWKEPIADKHYREERKTGIFKMQGYKFAVGLCGDLWDDNVLKNCVKRKPDVLLWPVYLDYPIKKWNKEKYDYIMRVSKYNFHIALVNSLCDGEDLAKGGALYVKNRMIVSELPAGKIGELILDVINF
ncbi:MAG: carbon-nitrogen hydrolase family protein [Clostridia bacterium]|nr:carbon-nitrogen hydrolase family protein [Clostridia bacterium]